ncbi:DNA-binding storekeeper protein-relatedtranscriptional regulator [Striga asiatica]|uniref:DNA-binding storekeeper protein-relatedtranscriptional regulator n=1 Tax=Striga asiatica TaxID=4170 RepID=A0A5A7R0M1_STRAF|nr:DNA-binding storekeeper protein-relatedtranscriptional regulator [Striga asiatica]
MAPNTQIPSKQKKPREPSSEEEEEDTEEQQSDSASSGDEQVMAKSRGADQDIGSDSDSDLGDYRLQPVTKTPKFSSKRARDEDEKKEKTVEVAKSPGGCITRLWSDDDEVTLLKGMIAFREARGRDPSSDMAAFHDYIKGNLKFEPSRVQLRSKVNRLKKRFMNALKKSNNGEDPIFSNPHEYSLFDLSKIIWGPSGSNSIQIGQNLDKNVLKENENDKEKEKTEMEVWGAKNHTKDARKKEMMRCFLMGTELKGFDKRTLAAANHMLEGEMVDEDKKRAWKELKIEEMKVVFRHSKVKAKQAKLLQQFIINS